MIDKNLIAPCGMDCRLCSRFLAGLNQTQKIGVKITYCSGCRTKNKCNFQKKCSLLRQNKIDFCYQCPDFPCDRLKKLDRRYRTFYRMSMIENQKTLKKDGLAKFWQNQQKKWACPKCDRLICCHNGLCFKCGLTKLKNKKRDKLYRWEEV